MELTGFMEDEIARLYDEQPEDDVERAGRRGGSHVFITDARPLEAPLNTLLSFWPTGPDDEHDYAFLGTVFDPRSYHHGRRSRIAQDASSARAFEWLFRQLSAGHPLPPQVRVCHCGSVAAAAGR